MRILGILISILTLTVGCGVESSPMDDTQDLTGQLYFYQWSDNLGEYILDQKLDYVEGTWVSPYSEGTMEFELNGLFHYDLPLDIHADIMSDPCEIKVDGLTCELILYCDSEVVDRFYKLKN